jgi:ATP-dependent RNA circularization protein (DNA/RNA ligase family)
MKPALFGIKAESSYDAEHLRMILHVHHIDDLMSHTANTQAGNTNNGVELLPLLGFVPVTDQKRIESDTSMFEKYKDRKFSVELKADGSSMSVFYVDKDIYPTQFGVTSHRRFIKRIQRPWYDVSMATGKLNKLCMLCKKAVMHVLHKDKPVYLPTNNQFILKANELNLEQLFAAVYNRTHRNLVYQGELIGPGIQSNRDSRSKSHWLLFDIYDVDECRYMTPGERHNFYYAYLFPYVEHVKVISRERQVLSEFPNADAMQELATVKTHKGNLAEGIVVKSEDMPYVSFKCVSRKYLLTGGHRDN